MIAGGVVLAMVLTHQVQVGGLWVPGLLAPDPARLTPNGPGWSARAGRGLWGWARSAVILGVAAWALKADGPAFLRLSELDASSLVRAAGSLIVELAYKLGLATLALGLLDFAIQHRRIEAMLRQTPDEHREDQKAIDGDPAVRARRLRLARSWRFNPTEILSGAVLVLSGPGGLTVVLGGQPPPRRFTVLGQVRGSSGGSLRRAAGRAGLPVVEAAELARHFAGSPSAARILPPGLAAELSALWPRPK
jgi:flagellar biosynthetic protein FlhB